MFDTAPWPQLSGTISKHCSPFAVSRRRERRTDVAYEMWLSANVQLPASQAMSLIARISSPGKYTFIRTGGSAPPPCIVQLVVRRRGGGVKIFGESFEVWRSGGRARGGGVD